MFNPYSDSSSTGIFRYLGEGSFVCGLLFLLSCCSTSTFLEVLFFKIFFPIIGAVHYAFCLVSISVIILVLDFFVDIP